MWQQHFLPRLQGSPVTWAEFPLFRCTFYFSLFFVTWKCLHVLYMKVQPNVYESLMPKQFYSPKLETVSPSALFWIHSLHQLTRLICSFYNASTNLKASKAFNEVIDLDRRLPGLSISSLPEPAVGDIPTIHHLTHFLFVGLLPCEYLDLEN